MITISILCSNRNDELQSMASQKLNTMILSNISLLLNQLDSKIDIRNVLKLTITYDLSFAGSNDMVFLLSDIFDTNKTQSIFDKLPNKSKILIDLHPESKNDWKCATNSSKSIQSCFEGQKKMSTKELLLRILDKHNKKQKHGNTKAILLTALALGLECYGEKSDTAFCKKLMNNNPQHIINHGFGYDMNKRGVVASAGANVEPPKTTSGLSSFVGGAASIIGKLVLVNAPIFSGSMLSWAGTLIATSFSALKSVIFVGLAYTALAPALALIAGISMAALIVVLLAVKKYRGANNLFGNYIAVFTTNIESKLGSMCSNIATFFRWLTGLDSPTIDNETNIAIDEDGDVIINVTNEQNIMLQNSIEKLASNVSKNSAEPKLKWILLTIAVKMPAIMIQLVRMTREVGIKDTFTMRGLKCAIFVVDAMIYHNLLVVNGLMLKTEHIFRRKLDHIPHKFDSLEDYGLEKLTNEEYPEPSTFQCIVYGAGVLAFALGVTSTARYLAGGSSNAYLANLQNMGVDLGTTGNYIKPHHSYIVKIAATVMQFVMPLSGFAEGAKLLPMYSNPRPIKLTTNQTSK